MACDDERAVFFAGVVRERVLELEQALIRIPSSSFQEHAIADHLAEHMTAIGLEVEMMPVTNPYDPDSVSRQPVGRLRGEVVDYLDRFEKRRVELIKMGNAASTPEQLSAVFGRYGLEMDANAARRKAARLRASRGWRITQEQPPPAPEAEEPKLRLVRA